jgi:DNA polymerase-3 subunit epsilon
VESNDELNRTTEYVELSSFQLPVIAASEQELTQHEDVLTQLDKSSGGNTVWRNAENSVA